MLKADSDPNQVGRKPVPISQEKVADHQMNLTLLYTVRAPVESCKNSSN